MDGQKVLVTGYIPIQGHPRSAEEYGRLGEDLFSKLDCEGGNFVVHPFYETVTETWLAKLIAAQRHDVAHSAGDNPAKNSLAYHCVQHQKFAWLLKAAMLHPNAQTLVWMDYGIGHVPGVTPDVVNAFMAAVRENDFAIPGCWARVGLMISDLFPCWRFCGGLMVVPAGRAYQLHKTVKEVVKKHIRHARNVDWEVNSLARAEQYLPIRWYEADHNQTLFTNYAKDLSPCATSSSSPSQLTSNSPSST